MRGFLSLLSHQLVLMTRVGVVPLVLYSLALALLFHIPLQQLDRLAVGDSGDARLNFLFLRWVYDYVWGHVPEQTQSLFNFYIFFPFDRALALSVNHIGSFPIVATLGIVVKDWFIRGNLWFYSCFLLNALSAFYASRAYLLQRGIDRRTALLLAFTTGLLFAFAHPRIFYSNHAQLMPHFATPLFLFYAHRTWRHGSERTALAAAFFFAWQVYLDIHLALMAELVVLFFVVGDCLRLQLEGQFIFFFKRRWRGVLMFCISAAILAIPLLSPYFEVGEQTGMRSSQELNIYAPRTTDYFRYATPDPVIIAIAPFFRSMQRFSGAHERYCFVGLAPLLCLLIYFIFSGFFAIAAVRRRAWSMVVKLMLPGAVFVGVVAYLTYHSGIQEFVFFKLPGYRSIRTPGRFAIVLPALSVLALMQLTVLSQEKLRYRRWLTRCLTLLLPLVVVLTIFDLAYSQVTTWQRRDNSRLDALFTHLQGPTVFLPYETNPYRNIDLMQAAAKRGIQIANGYSGTWPRGHRKLMHFQSRIPLPQLVEALHGHGFPEVVVMPGFETYFVKYDTFKNTANVQVLGPYLVARASSAARGKTSATGYHAYFPSFEVLLMRLQRSIEEQEKGQEKGK